MSKRVLVLVEGQTEERFVKDILAPELWQRGIYMSPTIVETKRVKSGPNFKGGVTNFAKFKNDARRLLTGAGDALVTTLIDYYGLPADFPGMDTRPVRGTPGERVRHVERAIAMDFGSPANFIPFLMLHEFEALLFASPDELPRVMTEPRMQPKFKAIRDDVATPEDINEQPHLAPSRRIAELFPAYKKILHGPTAAGRIGLPKIRSECPHFNEWMKMLETLTPAAVT